MPQDEHGKEQDRRWALRRSIDLDVELTDSAGLSYAAKVTNISEEGCQILTLSGSDLVRDRLHTIKIIGHGAITAYVIWTAKGKAGMTFSTPTGSATVKQLVMKSLYARMGRNLGRDASANDILPPLPPFPFDE